MTNEEAREWLKKYEGRHQIGGTEQAWKAIKRQAEQALANETRHYNSRTVECDECGHLGRGLPDVCDCCAGPKARPASAKDERREYDAAREENRR